MNISFFLYSLVWACGPISQYKSWILNVIVRYSKARDRCSKFSNRSAWWRHQMETFSALLTLCVGNSPVPVNSPHKGQWRGVLVFSFICVWINDWVNNREAGDLRRHRGHYDVIVMEIWQASRQHNCWGISNIKRIWTFLNQISLVRDFAISYHKWPYGILTPDPVGLTSLTCWRHMTRPHMTWDESPRTTTPLFTTSRNDFPEKNIIHRSHCSITVVILSKDMIYCV